MLSFLAPPISPAFPLLLGGVRGRLLIPLLLGGGRGRPPFWVKVEASILDRILVITNILRLQWVIVCELSLKNIFYIFFIYIFFLFIIQLSPFFYLIN